MKSPDLHSLPGLHLVPKPTSRAVPETIDEAPNPGVRSDSEQRIQALDPTRSWVVEAPAGSGKTGLIIQRYLTLLANPGVDSPEQVLAITFTNKAAAELHERVIAQLNSASTAQPPQREFDHITRPLARAVLERSLAFGWDLLAQPKRLNIRTIDSVCSQIARSLPILSGSSGALSPVEDAGPLFALAAERTFLELGGNDTQLHDALHRVLLHRDGQLADAEALLAEMLRWREQWGELIPLGRRELDDHYLDTVILPRLEHALQEAILTSLQQVVELVPDPLLRVLCTLAHDLAQLPGYNGEPNPLAFCAGRSTSPKAILADLTHWQALHHLLITPSTGGWRKSFNVNVIRFLPEKEHKARLKELIQQLEDSEDLLAAFNLLGSLPPAKYPIEQWPVAKALFRVLSRALAELQLVFAERGECDFAEFALAARTALSHEHGSDELAAGLGFTLQHLLIDEMQDTSSGQYDLIQSLTAGWDGHSQTLFLVGDPKQSIYLFRQARVERFLRVLNEGRLGDLTLGRLALSANFRSQAALVRAFNQDFSAIFHSGSELPGSAEVRYQAATPRRPSSAAGDGRTWHLNPVPDQKSASSADVLSERPSDAEAIRRIIEEWRARPLPEGRLEPWKLAVLVRTRSHLQEILAALQQPTPIPYRAIDIEPLEDRREVKDLLALTRALMHPADRVAWLAVLRAPWCGLTLADLHQLTGADNPSSRKTGVMGLIEQHGHNLSDDGISRLERVWPALDAAVRQRARMPLAELVDRTWLTLGGDAYLSAEETTNVRRYLQRLGEMDRAHPGTLDADSIERSLARLYAAPTSAPDAVDLLTIHGAKGLEWDLVCVPALERNARSNRSKLLTWLELDSAEEQSAHVLLAPIIGRGKESQQLNVWLNDIHKQREAAERKRLYYVACTRAREALHLFASPQADATGVLKIPSGSLLKVAHLGAITNTIASTASPGAPHLLPEEYASRPLTLAAAAAGNSGEPSQPQSSERPSPLLRVPLDFQQSAAANQPPATIRMSGIAAPKLPRAESFERPEGSLAARAFGNAVHAFVEQLAQQASATGTLAQPGTLSTWLPRITALLRAEGLSAAAVAASAKRVLQALENTLEDPTGRWILHPHATARTEYALTTLETTGSTTVRLDRTFLAGALPLSAGQDYRWIVDYKTSTLESTAAQGAATDSFLTAERARYQPQLDTYAGRMTAQESIRLALYYPELKRLVWWPYETT